MPYRGRFAPSPTGPLHAGSLLTALASYLDAKAAGGQWLVRIEDVDFPRSQAGAENAILTTLEAYGLEWDEPVIRQSERTPVYLEYLSELRSKAQAYPCTCTRAELSTRGALHTYDRHCLIHGTDPAREQAIRFCAQDNPEFDDRVFGRSRAQSSEIPSDFVIYRRDQIVSYHLAVVVDDHLQQINQIVRGSDLMWETPKHLMLQEALNFSHPNYAHLPLLINEEGQKLSKQTKAAPISTEIDKIRNNLTLALKTLNQNPDESLQYTDIRGILSWAIENWNLGQVPHKDYYQSAFLQHP